MIMTHDESIKLIKDFFEVEQYDKANHILNSLLEAKIANITGPEQISMPELEPGLKEFFNNK